MSEKPRPTITEGMKKRLTDHVTRTGGDRPVAPIAPLIRRDTPTPIQDTPKPPAKPTPPAK